MSWFAASRLRNLNLVDVKASGQELTIVHACGTHLGSKGSHFVAGAALLQRGD